MFFLQLVKMGLWSFSMFLFIDYCRGHDNWVTGFGASSFLIMTYYFTVDEIKSEIRNLRKEINTHLDEITYQVSK